MYYSVPYNNMCFYFSKLYAPRSAELTLFDVIVCNSVARDEQARGRTKKKTKLMSRHIVSDYLYCSTPRRRIIVCDGNFKRRNNIMYA